MNEHDHFSGVLDVESVEEPLEPHFDGHVGMEGDDEAPLHEPQASRKKPIPKALLLIGGMVAFVVVGAGYQHFFGAHPQNVASAGMMGNPGIDPGDTPLPSGTAITQQTQSGMLTENPASPPLPSHMQGQAAEPVGAIASQPNGRDMPARSSMAVSMASAGAVGDDSARDPASSYRQVAAAPPAAPQAVPTAPPAGTSPGAPVVSAAIPASFAFAGATPGPLVGNTTTVAGADVPSATQATMMQDDKDLQIAKLQAEVEALQRRGHGGDARSPSAHPAAHRTGKHAIHGAHIVRGHATGGNTETRNVRSAPRHERTSTEVLVGYAIKQVIPGQGWIQDEESGKQQVVAVGDFIGTAKVVRIDADNYRIVTTAGVIQ